MNKLRILYNIAYADFFERTRRYSFLIVLGITLLSAYFFVPPLNAKYATLKMGNARGIYNSAWVGGCVTILAIICLGFLGFYLVKNCIERDSTTGVGQIIATTPLSKSVYILGKLISNFCFLAVMVVVTAIGAILVQLMRGEVMQLDLWKLLAPFLILVLPTMVGVASLAVIFEIIPLFKKGFGNIFYFVVYMILMAPVSIFSVFGANIYASGNGNVLSIFDALGLTEILESMTFAMKESMQGNENVFISIGLAPVKGELVTFLWNGIEWSTQIILVRVMWIVIAVAVAILMSLFFRRFDPTYERHYGLRKLSEPLWSIKEENNSKYSEMCISLTPMDVKFFKMSMLHMTVAELKLVTKGLSWWWWGVTIAFVVTCLICPVRIAHQYILPFAWVWPILIWSGMGSLEMRYNTSPMVYSSPNLINHQFIASWISGVLITAMLGSGMAVKLLGIGNWAALFAWLVSILFIPTLALAMGVWTNSGKMFEVVYLILWFGVVNKVRFVDFMGVSTSDSSIGIQLAYFVATIILFIIAVAGKKRQMG